MQANLRIDSDAGVSRALTRARRREVLMFLLPWVALLGCGGSRQPATSQSASEAAAGVGGLTESSPTTDGWENLLPSAGLEGYRRVPLDPLADKPVWQMRPDGSLFIDGEGAKEMLLGEREFSDGTLHVEWRFLEHQSPTPGGAAAVYNGGVYVRTALDGKSWVQLQVSMADKPPVVGDLIAQVPGRAERVEVFQTQPSAGAPVGEWNSYDVSMRGSTIELRVNGKPSVVWTSCPMVTGHIGLQAEGSPIEVRAFRFQPP
jgi:Domain of Unknown Function (DUF1080)